MNRYHKVFSRLYKPNYEKIKKSIVKADIISFDIYDTMIRRNVMDSKDIYDLVETEFRNITGRYIKDYKRLRCESEYIARKDSEDEEIQFEQIFENMRDVSQEDKEILKRLEIQYELDMSCPNPKIIELYNFALTNNKRVIITSDMYLEEKIIKEILKQNGIYVYEKLFLSSSYGKSKSRGSLYKCILKKLQINPQKLLHIGDSIQSDILQAHRNGIKTCYIPRFFNNLKYWGKYHNKYIKDEIQYSVFKAFLNNNISDVCIKNDKGLAKRIGFEVLGPILAGYSVWLNNEIKKNEIDKVFFLAREGKILQQAYNIVFKESTIPQSYLYISRRAAIVPLLSSAKNFDEFVDIISVLIKTPELKIIRIICSFDEKVYKSKLREIGLVEEDSIYDIKNREQFFSIIQELGYEKFEMQKACLKKYLSQESFNGNVLISDSGWSGTIQQIIQDLLGDDERLHIRGAYIGVRDVRSKERYENLDRNGYLFTPLKNPNFDYMTRFTNEILEKMLSNEEESTIGYEERDKVHPVLAEKMFTDMNKLFVQDMQSEALRFVKVFSNNLKVFEKIIIKPEIIFNGYINFAVYPSKKIVNIFSKLNSKYEMQMPILPDKNIFYYLLHIKELKQDLSSYCSIFLLKKIFGLPLPYYEISKFMVDKIGMKSNYRKNCEK